MITCAQWDGKCDLFVTKTRQIAADARIFPASSFPKGMGYA